MAQPMYYFGVQVNPPGPGQSPPPGFALGTPIQSPPHQGAATGSPAYPTMGAVQPQLQAQRQGPPSPPPGVQQMQQPSPPPGVQPQQPYQPPYQPDVSSAVAATVTVPAQLVMSKAEAAIRPSLAHNLNATSPMLCGCYNRTLTPLPIQRLVISAECHISTAFVTIEMWAYVPKEWGGSPLYFFMPKTHDTTITEVVVENRVRDSMYATAVVPNDDVVSGKFSSSSSQAKDPALDGIDMNDPELFTLPLTAAKPGDQYKLRLMYFQPLDFEAGQYTLKLPTTIPAECFPPGVMLNEILRGHIVINTGVPETVRYNVWSHPFTLIAQAPGRVELALDAPEVRNNVDISCGYQVWGDAIVAAVNVQPPEPQPEGAAAADPRGTFCLTLSPPAPDRTMRFARSVIFVVDRSGSMTGVPLEYARQALMTGLGLLTEEDQFTVVAFDHEQLWWSKEMQQATEKNVVACEQWLSNNVTARGLTDILAPLKGALELLSVKPQGLPCIFLLTDGAVDNERQICNYLDQYINGAGGVNGLAPRVSTFAIGPFCNHYFLKQMSVTGRGQFDVAFRPNDIATQMRRMLMAAATPVLTDITLGIDGLTHCEIYPYPICDLFCGKPLLVAGKFTGTWPATIQLNGLLPGGQPWSQTVYTTQAANIPLAKVFAKSQLDCMTARAWLEDNKALVQQVVNLSVESGVPCAHTRIVGFETNHALYTKMQEKKKKGKKINVAKYAVGGGAAIAVIVGVGVLLAFGDVAATFANAGIFGALGDGIGGVLNVVGGDCCSCCGAILSVIDCSICGSCGDICGACGDIGPALCAFFECCGSGMGDVCGALCSLLGSC